MKLDQTWINVILTSSCWDLTGSLVVAPFFVASHYVAIYGNINPSCIQILPAQQSISTYLWALVRSIRSMSASMQLGKAGQCSLIGQWTNPKCWNSISFLSWSIRSNALYLKTNQLQKAQCGLQPLIFNINILQLQQLPVLKFDDDRLNCH